MEAILAFLKILAFLILLAMAIAIAAALLQVAVESIQEKFK